MYEWTPEVICFSLVLVLPKIGTFVACTNEALAKTRMNVTMWCKDSPWYHRFCSVYSLNIYWYLHLCFYCRWKSMNAIDCVFVQQTVCEWNSQTYKNSILHLVRQTTARQLLSHLTIRRNCEGWCSLNKNHNCHKCHAWAMCKLIFLQ